MSGVKGRKMIDWEMMKAEWFLYPGNVLLYFFRSKGMKWSGNTKDKTMGWGQEKKEWKESLIRDAMQKAEQEYTQSLTTALKTLLTRGLLDKMNNEDEKQAERFFTTVTARDLKRYWEILRIENGLPTTLNKVENTNKNIEMSHEELLNDIEKKNNSILNDKKNR